MTIVVHGFQGNIRSQDNPLGCLQWYCSPNSWTQTNKSKREGRDGKWYLLVDDDDHNNKDDHNSDHQGTTTTTATLVVYPAAKKDFWRRTYYEPLLIKDDGAFLYCDTLPPATEHYCTVETNFTLWAACQFDQAGIMIRWDDEHWIKTGIEVVDQKARLSCVVTNVYSDWSTQSWPSFDGIRNSCIFLSCDA